MNGPPHNAAQIVGPEAVPPPRSSQPIAIEFVEGASLAALRSAWNDLLTRADAPNVLMDPATIAAAATVSPESRSQALLAWKPALDGNRKLIGLWGFSVGRPPQSPFPIKALTMPPGPLPYLAAPVVDRNHLDETLDAMLDALAEHPRLPKIAALSAMSAEGETMEALIRVLAARESSPCMLERFQRPKIASTLDGESYLKQALSASSRKKLRQHRRRLAEQGELSVAIATDPNDVLHALELFMQMEASGWKGRKGTALLCNAREAAFMREAIVELANAGSAAIHALYLDRKPLSMQIVARAGPTAFTLKTAYDETFREFSPGMLLFEDYTRAFLADRSIASVDSCAHDDDGYMSAWLERQQIVDLWIDVRRGGSRGFRLLGALQQRYRALRAMTKRAYLAAATLRHASRRAS
jgi:CelD/BcsL family acetyltransferase involved in cellulose biosynthesis